MSTETLKSVEDLVANTPKIVDRTDQPAAKTSRLLVDKYFDLARQGVVNEVPMYEDIEDAMEIDFDNPTYLDVPISGKELQYSPSVIELARLIHQEAEAIWQAENQVNGHPYWTVTEQMHKILRGYEHSLPHRPVPVPQLKKIN